MRRSQWSPLVWALLLLPCAIPARDEPEATHWSFRPLQPVEVPTSGAAWVRSPIDEFILRRLRAARLSPGAEASREAWLRRVHLDLTGLPPSEGELASFLSDDSLDAFSRRVDRLLLSPRYGERWGRHWLDVVRYADSNGADENSFHANAWRYRDWVIAALNDDLPFDRFVTLQVAGDLIAAQRNAHASAAESTWVATGFLLLGPKILAEPDKVKMRMDIIDEQIETMSKSFLALSVECARCHDHKFDPIASRDYYAVAGVLKSTHLMGRYETVARWLERPIGTPEELGRLERWKKELGALKGKKGDKEVARRVQLISWISKFPRAMSVREHEVPVDQAVLLRGDHNRPTGAPVARGVISTLESSLSSPKVSKTSGRRELASWLASPSNPLTSRVTAPRLWQGHFGRGLVRTPNDFGVRGEEPTHPKLLDWLANELVRSDWSLKHLQRLIVLSSTYRMSSQSDEGARDADPEELTYWRFQPRRLEAEPIRDALLFVAGELDLEVGGTLQTQSSYEYVREPNRDESRRRAVYLPVIRNRLNEFFKTFDYTSPEVSVGLRTSSVLPQQALYWLNSSFVAARAKAVAREVSVGSNDTNESIRRVYRRLYSRSARVEERLRVRRFLGESPDRSRWEKLIHVLLLASEFSELQ
ncbi:MAG: DUF1549 and DUF1553 domain-containing protein [Planctomycetota bacterium]